MRSYDEGLTQTFYNTRRSIVGPFKFGYDAATLCCRMIVKMKERDLWPRMQTGVNLLLRTNQRVSTSMVHRPK